MWIDLGHVVNAGFELVHRAVSRGLPDYLYWIAGKLSVAGYYGKSFGDGLGDQEPIEGIAVVRFERTEGNQVTGTQGKQVESLLAHFVDEILNRRADLRELSLADLDGELPEGGDADEQFIIAITHDISGTLR